MFDCFHKQPYGILANTNNIYIHKHMLPIVSSKKIQSPSQKKRSKEEGKAPRVKEIGNKVFFISLGCPRNLVDTEVMIGILLQAGYEASASLEEADYIVINTCGFLEASRKESVDTIKESIKNKKPTAKVVATGCMVQNHSDRIREQCPEIHYLLGSGDVHGILKAVQAEEAGDGVTDARSFLESGEVPRTLSTPKNYAYLKIAEGCRKRCSFCIIPDIKGPLKSKNEAQILKEIKILLDGGVSEIILIAQDLGDFGKDAGFHKSDGLIHILKKIMEEEKRDFWLRLMYLYPDEITDELIQVIKSNPRICQYLDMPIQHVSDPMLKAMRRATSKKQIIETIAKLRRELPDVVIRTSLMVGFPGETEEQFNELVSFVQENPLDNIGIFKYSKEEGSHSATLPNHLPEEIKQKRFEKLAKVQQKVLLKRLKNFVGNSFDVVVEGYHPETKLLMRGRHAGQAPEVDGEVLINDGRKVSAFGKRYRVEITDVAGYDLVGRVV